MTAELVDPFVRSRQAHSRVLAAMQDTGTAKSLAQVLGVSESTVSRIKSEKLEDSISLIYHLGFKVVPEDNVCVRRDRYEAMATLAKAAMSCEETSRKLIWESE